MPDITMCSAIKTEDNSLCPLCQSCYRHMAVASEFRQSYFVSAPFIIEPDGTSCEYFWKTEDTK
jgi:hypothetical protein